MNFIVVVPTRGRPAQVNRLIDSFEKTTDNAQLVFVIDGDDNSYDGFDWRGHGCGEVNPRASLTQKLNHTAQNLIDQCDEMMWQGDDHEFITPHWDTKLLEVRKEWGSGWLYPNNGRRSDVPETWTVSSDVIKTLGWYANPLLAHYNIDQSIAELGKRSGLIRFVPDVQITHHHYTVDKETEYDELYRETEQLFLERDMQAFQQWRGSNVLAGAISQLRRNFNPDVAWVKSRV